MNFGGLNPGLYFVKIKNNSKSYLRKIIKNSRKSLETETAGISGCFCLFESFHQIKLHNILHPL